MTHRPAIIVHVPPHSPTNHSTIHATHKLCHAHAGLRALPDLSRLHHLDDLAVSFNRLPALPLPCLPTKLTALNLSHNQLEQLPEQLPQHLPLLAELDVSYNR